MEYNILSKLVQRIDCNTSREQMERELHLVLDELGYIYSYIVYNTYKDDVLWGWTIQYMFSQTDEYNTLPASLCVEGILQGIEHYTVKPNNVLCYRQPDIEVMMRVYEPLLRKAAKNTCEKWTGEEYEDALSSAYLVMLRLYRHGYYIHKRLFLRAYNNEILMQLRHKRNEPQMVSLDTVVENEQNDVTTYANIIPDEQYSIRMQELDLAAAVASTLKEFLLQYMTEREYDELLRDYGQGHTTNTSRRRMSRIKDKFARLGITYKEFRRRLTDVT